MDFSQGDRVIATKDILTCRFEIIVHEGTKGTIKSLYNGLYLVEFDEDVFGETDEWLATEEQIRLLNTLEKLEDRN